MAIRIPIKPAVLAALSSKSKHLGERIATSGYALLAMTAFYDLSFGLKIRLTTRPERMATVMPPAVAFRPPVKIPRKPLS